jgi:hypothetical protein
MQITDLPNYIYCNECSYPHLLVLNRTMTGKWSIAYVDFQNHLAIAGLALNDSDTIREAVARMAAALDRRDKRGENNGPMYGVPNG